MSYQLQIQTHERTLYTMQKKDIQRLIIGLDTVPTVSEALALIEEQDLKDIEAGTAKQPIPYVHRQTLMNMLGLRATREVRAAVREAGWWDNLYRRWDDDGTNQEYFLREQDLQTSTSEGVLAADAKTLVDKLQAENKLNDLLEIELAYALLGENINWDAYSVTRNVSLPGPVRKYVYSLGYTRGVRSRAGAEWLRFKTK